MLIFPQLSSGAVAQYPLVKRRHYRTVRSTLPSGAIVDGLDLGAAQIIWELSFEALDDTERFRLEAFFKAAEGRLNEFLFLDPADNLLRWSEDLKSPVWIKSPTIMISNSLPDPMGGTAAASLTNNGSANQSIYQVITAPGRYHYAFSAYIRSAANHEITLYRESNGERQQKSFQTSPHWRRFVLSGAGTTESESVSFGLSLPAGACVEIYGVQAEAQPAPSQYRKTTTYCGVHTGARFDQDSLEITTKGPAQSSTKVRIVAPLSI